MRVSWPGLAAVMALTMMTATATAQSSRRPTQRRPTPEQEFTFEDDEVEGGRVGPEGSPIHVPSRRSHRTLVRPRTHFVPELLVSVERL